jgi:hypothetical protein
MNKYEHLIEVYESWDLDSLCNEAYYLSCDLRDCIASRCNVRDPLTAALMVGAYFMDADYRSDGDEDELYRRLFKGAPMSESGFVWLREYREYNWQPWVEDYLRSIRSAHELDVALRFGIVICAADGYINDAERNRILRWA